MEWEEKLDKIAQMRAVWRSQGASTDEISVRTRNFLAAKEWLA